MLALGVTFSAPSAAAPPEGATSLRAPISADETAFFENRVRPLLAKHCWNCHGAKKQEASLRLDAAEFVARGSDNGAVVAAGEPDNSPLIAAVRYAADVQMPPAGRLPQTEIDALVAWVKSGAPWPAEPHASQATGPRQADPQALWSLKPVVEPALPAVADRAWPLAAVDYFILEKLAARGLTPAPAADKRTLIRRATFDLVGLPPTPAEVQNFLADTSDGAFARVIERLLASPHYGERWGRHWLDVVRYADTAGETADYPVREAYRYRDYVIRAFNADKPYDEFLREQIAGDVLAAEMLAGGPLASPQAHERYAERLTATGYLAISRRFGFDPQNYHHLTLADTIDTLGRSVLGLSLGCARCHDHKYDPVSMGDYYALYGIFDSARFPFPGSEEQKRPHDFVPELPPAEVDALVKPHQQRLAELQAEVDRLEPERAKAEAELKTSAGAADNQPQIEKLKSVIEQAAKAAGERDAWAAKAPAIAVLYAMAEGAPHNAKIQKRGEPLQPGDEAPRGFLAILGGDRLPDGAAGSGRRELAEWLARPTNPLSARVIVNRIWQQHFGRGIVPTPSDFGARGAPPSHPQLLDYLAARFMAEGWSIKSVHRAIMLSRTYQLSGAATAKQSELDPSNELLARFPRRRLDAESIRDGILAVCGGLDRSPGGPHPFPPLESWGFTQHAPFKAVYETNHRSAYLMTQRIARHPFLALFDGPDPNSSTAERSLTTTPTQALYMMNDPLVHREADRLARRLLAEIGDDAARIEAAHQLLFGRPASEAERTASQHWLGRYHERLGAVPEDQRLAAAWAGFVRTLLASNEFIYVD